MLRAAIEVSLGKCRSGLLGSECRLEALSRVQKESHRASISRERGLPPFSRVEYPLGLFFFAVPDCPRRHSGDFLLGLEA